MGETTSSDIFKTTVGGPSSIRPNLSPDNIPTSHRHLHRCWHPSWSIHQRYNLLHPHSPETPPIQPPSVKIRARGFSRNVFLGYPPESQKQNVNHKFFRISGSIELGFNDSNQKIWNHQTKPPLNFFPKKMMEKATSVDLLLGNWAIFFQGESHRAVLATVLGTDQRSIAGFPSTLIHPFGSSISRLDGTKNTRQGGWGGGLQATKRSRNNKSSSKCGYEDIEYFSNKYLFIFIKKNGNFKIGSPSNFS